LEGLEAFVEKRVEYGEMMEDHVGDLEAVIQEQLVLVEGLERAAKLAEDRRLLEFQQALERMNPAEAEAAQRAEQERASRLQREYADRLAELDAEWASIRASVRAESPDDCTYDSADESPYDSTDE
jgi:multidrug efflux pump subunit AcrA (membrane-fusion protein)